MPNLEEINRIYLPMECVIPKEESRKFSGGKKMNPEYGEHNLGRNPKTIETIGKWMPVLVSRIYLSRTRAVPY
jgi:hypothetical protein